MAEIDVLKALTRLRLTKALWKRLWQRRAKEVLDVSISRIPLQTKAQRQRMIERIHTMPMQPTPHLVQLRSRSVTSSWVERIHLIDPTGEGLPRLAVTFRDGASVWYEGTSQADYDLMRAASSKGKAIWRYFYATKCNLITL